MNKTSIALAIAGPQLKKKFEFKVLETVTFKVNKIKDLLELEGHGSRDGVMFETRRQVPLKYSENKDYANLFFNSIGNNLKEAEVDVVYLTIDFKAKKVHSEVFYRKKKVDESGTEKELKLKKTFTNEF